jgi:hypothetical protein
MNTKLLLIGLLLFPTLSMAEVSVDINLGAPPAPVREAAGRPPHRGYVWNDGYYRWEGRRYMWTPGRWVRPPHRNAVWVPHRWEHREHGYVMVPGHWR